ncbi:hypothetical protein P8C59_007846 [Phyllachora maydis]|uniref:CAP-Gly domain-containing protein n=1 Tax=Phyllachora maydis TaxID=1825666 RepID=A0AAD9IA99_9PEZI|nr:hypothetical protein P8C59_007846 [Phyllachora maydis]
MAVVVGDRLSYHGAVATVRFVGQVAGTEGTWLGIEWDDASRGKHDGQHKGVRYFSCRSHAPTAASFVRPTRPVDAPRTFVAALHAKYASEAVAGRQQQRQPIVISGKVAEEVGFDKIQRKQARLGELSIVILDGARIVRSRRADAGELPIRHVCPKVVELDLSRNLFTAVGTAVEICAELPLLKTLRLNGNRFHHILADDRLHRAEEAFRRVEELALDEALMDWDEICHVISTCPSLSALFARGNQLTSLPRSPPASLASTLVSLHLDYNDFTSLADIAPLATLTALRNLHLKGNRISSIAGGGAQDSAAAAAAAAVRVFSESLQYVDMSYNEVETWSFVDALPQFFPGLSSLRFAHNPIYENPDLDTASDDTITSTPPPPPQQQQQQQQKAAAPTTDESYMLLLARLPGLQALNFSTITHADRQNAEMFYLSRIARHLAAVPEGPEHEARVLVRHRRWAELCALHGEPAVVRRKAVDPNLLDARLITAHLCWRGAGPARERTARIPRAFDMYAVKGMVGKLFGLPPLDLCLVWETGEWDPVAGLDEEGGGSDEEEEEDEEEEAAELARESSQAGGKGGRWVKREVELRDGPRQFGYCVDGSEVRVRVELRA